MILIDMSLSPLWAPYFIEAGLDAVHWSAVGPAEACDTEILEFAAERNWIVFTHNLDFSAVLAALQLERASVVQVRTLDILPSAIAEMVVDLMRQYEAHLEAGALVDIDVASHAIRMPAI